MLHTALRHTARPPRTGAQDGCPPISAWRTEGRERTAGDNTHTDTCTNAVTGYLRSSWTSRKGITRSSACFPLRMSNHGGMDHTRAAVGGGCPAALYYDRKVRVGQKKLKKKDSVQCTARFILQTVDCKTCESVFISTCKVKDKRFISTVRQLNVDYQW